MTTTIGTRESLIRAAEKELIRSDGHLEMQAVAKQARVSVGLAYHHFGSKAGLIAAVVEAFYSRLDEQVFKGAKSPSEDWADTEKWRIAFICRLSFDHRAACHRGIEPRTRSPGCRDSLHQPTAYGGALMLQTAQRDGVIPGHINPHLIIALMIGGIRQALIGAVMSKPRPDAGKLQVKFGLSWPAPCVCRLAPASKNRP